MSLTNDESTSGAQPVTKNDLKEFLQAFTSAVDEKIDTVKSDLAQLQDSQEKSRESFAKKIKESTAIKWRREGNKRQFEFNQQVLAKCSFLIFLD